MDNAAPETPSPQIRRLLHPDVVDALDIGPDDFVFDAPGVEAVAAECAGIVLAAGDAARAATLLAAGAPCVLLGEAPLRDGGDSIRSLAAAFEPACVGVYVPARRMEVSWAMDTVSNPDFRFLAPSTCEPCWEILAADGRRTGTRVDWWSGEMVKRGAGVVLVRADIRDDDDLNLCAGLVESLGDALWLCPLEDEAPAISDWIVYGRLTRIVLPGIVA